MKTWTPRLKDLDDAKLDLSAEDAFVFNLIDGAVTVDALSRLAGLPPGRVETILDRLTDQGALALTEKPPVNLPPRLDARASEGRSWRRIFEQDYRPLTVDDRVQLARTASSETLRALCFDPSPRVIIAIFENVRFKLEHAQLIAEHHRTDVGLDQIGQNKGFLQDGQVQRHLFRNPQCSVHLLRRTLKTKSLSDVHQLCTSPEMTEQMRSMVNKEFPEKFKLAPAEERVNLILRSEGRCLLRLGGTPLDAMTEFLLRQRPLSSIQLIQNLARWPSTTASVLELLAGQPAVRSSPALRNSILRHPNTPARLKSKHGL